MLSYRSFVAKKKASNCIFRKVCDIIHAFIQVCPVWADIPASG